MGNVLMVSKKEVEISGEKEAINFDEEEQDFQSK